MYWVFQKVMSQLCKGKNKNQTSNVTVVNFIVGNNFSLTSKRVTFKHEAFASQEDRNEGR